MFSYKFLSISYKFHTVSLSFILASPTFSSVSLSFILFSYFYILFYLNLSITSIKTFEITLPYLFPLMPYFSNPFPPCITHVSIYFTLLPQERHSLVKSLSTAWFIKSELCKGTPSRSPFFPTTVRGLLVVFHSSLLLLAFPSTLKPFWSFGVLSGTSGILGDHPEFLNSTLSPSDSPHPTSRHTTVLVLPCF